MVQNVIIIPILQMKKWSDFTKEKELVNIGQNWHPD